MIRKERITNLKTNPEGEITKILDLRKGIIKVISIKFPEDSKENVSEETLISFENDLGVTLKYPPNNKDFYDYPRIKPSSGTFSEITEEPRTEQMTITGNLVLKVRNASANRTISSIEIIFED